MNQLIHAIQTRLQAPPTFRYSSTDWSKLWLIVALFSLVLISVGCSRRAQDSAGQEQRAMDTLKGRIWYDYEKQAYRKPVVSREFDSPVRVNGYEWVDPASKAAPPPGRRGPWNWNWSLFDTGLSTFVWVMLGIGLIALALILAGTSMKHWSKSEKLSKQANAIAIDPTRVVDLPFEARDEMQDPLEAARRMAEAGDYDGAVQFLYGYMLLALDRAGQVVLHRGKTNRMYMFELSGQRTLRELLQPAMLAFEDVFFGRHTIERERFTQLWRNLDAFHNELAPIMQGRELAPEVAPA